MQRVKGHGNLGGVRNGTDNNDHENVNSWGQQSYNAANPGVVPGAYSVSAAAYYSTAAYPYPPYCMGDGTTTWPNNEQVTYVGNYNGQMQPEATAAAYAVDRMYDPATAAAVTAAALASTSFPYGATATAQYYANNAPPPAEYQAWNAAAVRPAVHVAPAGKQYNEYYRDGGVYNGVDTLKGVDQRLHKLDISADNKAPDTATKFSYAALSRNSSDSYANSTSSSNEKKISWASIAKQPAKPVPQASSGGSKKKGPGMPPPPMVPGRLNIDLNTWEPKNNTVPKVPVAQAPPPPSAAANSSLATKPVWNGPVLAAPEPTHTPPPDMSGHNAHPEPPYVNSAPPPPSHVSAPPPMRVPSPQTHKSPYSAGPPYSMSGGGGSGGRASASTAASAAPAPSYQPAPPPMTRAPHAAPSSTKSASPPPPPSDSLSSSSLSLSASSASGSPPHSVVDKLKDKNNYNPCDLELPPTGTRFFVIKSYSEDDVHRSIKYEIWCSTEHGNKRLDDAFANQRATNGAVYLFFSVNGSGHFCGVARMISPVDYGASSSVWAQDKWKGQFRVRWIYVKDVPNQQLRHIRLENNENKPVTNSRDTQEVPYDKGLSVLRTIHAYSHTTSIFDDFTHYEKRQEEGDHNKRGPPSAHQGPPMHHNNHSAPPPHRSNPFDSRGMMNKDRDRDRDRDGGGSSFSQMNYRRGMRNNTGGGFTNQRNHSNALRS